jgi:glutaredoxin-like protein DUF836
MQYVQRMLRWLFGRGRSGAQEASAPVLPPVPPPVPPTVPLVLYTRPACSLCEEMKREIASANLPRPYDLTEVDISGDPALEAEHGESIPVLTIAGHKAFKGRLTTAELLRKFERLAREFDRVREGGR